MPPDLWSGFYGNLVAAIASILGTVLAAIVGFWWGGRRERIDRINTTFINLLRAIEQFRLALLADHMEAVHFRSTNGRAYQAANANINIAMSEIVYAFGEPLRDQIVKPLMAFQKSANDHMNKRVIEIDQHNKEIQKGNNLMVTSEWMGSRRDIHTSVESDLAGRSEGLMRTIRAIAETERAKAGGWRGMFG